jgi:hypothetical protein
MKVAMKNPKTGEMKKVIIILMEVFTVGVKMKRLAIFIIAAYSMTLISGCDDFKKSFNKEYDKAFIESWKSSFVSSCVGDDNRKSTFCNCVANKSIASLSVEQLKNIEVIKEKSIPQCR